MNVNQIIGNKAHRSLTKGFGAFASFRGVPYRHKRCLSVLYFWRAAAYYRNEITMKPLSHERTHA
jgi:hypothetical protein